MVHELNSSQFLFFWIRKWDSEETVGKKIICFCRTSIGRGVKEADVWMKWCVFAQNVNRIQRLWSIGKNIWLYLPVFFVKLCVQFFSPFHLIPLLLWPEYHFFLLLRVTANGLHISMIFQKKPWKPKYTRTLISINFFFSLYFSSSSPPVFRA